MICYNCGFKVTDQRSKECHFCGAKFGTSCTNCKAPNPPMGRFCFNCGKTLLQPASSGNVQNFGTLSEARKNVAVIFADVSGFTALSEKLDPEIVRELINDCFNYITKPVYELEGNIDKFIGDCVMILFGAQSTHSDDARRAVLCGMQMMSLAHEFSEQRVKPLGFELDLSIGIHYGLVVTGVVGNYFDKDYTVMGDTVNTAQRIQSNTPKSTIYVSDAVYKETQEDLVFSEPVSFFAKNKETEIICYIPKKMAAASSLAQSTIPFIGRSNELQSMMESFNFAQSGNMRAILLCGPAGIGKSRLASQFVDQVQYNLQSNENTKILQQDCTPSSTAKPYAMLSSLVMNIMNINPGDTTIAKQSRIISYLSYILEGAEEDEIKRSSQFLGLVLGFETEKEFKNILNAMDTKTIQTQIKGTFLRFFSAFGKKFQACIRLEDVHWCDSQSLSILRDVIESGRGSLLFVITSRNIPKDFDKLEEKFQLLQMKTLSRDEITDIAKAYIHCAHIDNEFISSLERLSGGNPLYLYEFLTYLRKNNLYYIENNAAIGDWSESRIPVNLQSLILSNLNDMSPSTLEMIQIASIIGKEFTISLLNRLLNRDSEHSGDIHSAVQSNLISLKKRYTHRGHVEHLYAFNHDAEREAIYESILLKQKKDFHKKAAETMEQLYQEELENYFEILGDHYEKAGNEAKAAGYYYSAAVNQKGRFNYPEALEYYRKALSIYQNVSQTKQDRLFEIYKDSGELLQVMACNNDALDYANKAALLADDDDEAATISLLVANIYKDQGKYEDALTALKASEGKLQSQSSLYGSLLHLKSLILMLTGRQDEALLCIKQSEKILSRSKDYGNLAKALNITGSIYFSMGNLEQALSYYTRSYQYAERVQDLQILMKTASNLGIIYHNTGKTAKASDYFTSALDLSKRLSHKQGYISNCSNLGILYIDKGYFGKAQDLFETGLKMAREANSPYAESVILTNLGDIAYHKGAYNEAINWYYQALKISADIDDIEGTGSNNLALAKTALAQKQYDAALDYIEKTEPILATLESSDILSDYNCYLALYHSRMENYEQALHFAEIARKISEESHFEKKVGRDLRLIGIIHQKQSRHTEAIALFDESIKVFEDTGSDFEAAKSYFCKSQSCLILGMQEEASKSYKASMEKIKSIDWCHWTDIINQNTKQGN